MFVDLLGEEWRAIAGFENRYEVSNLGRVRTWIGRPGKGCQNLRADHPKLKIEERHRCGYRQVSLAIGHQKSKMFYVHRLVVEAFIGPIPQSYEVRHLDGVKANNKVGNLATGTGKENAGDRRLHGHDRLGEQHHDHRLTRDDVRSIRRLHDAGETWASIARTFGITRRAAFCAGTGVTWRHVENGRIGLG